MLIACRKSTEFDYSGEQKDVTSIEGGNLGTKSIHGYPVKRF